METSLKSEGLVVLLAIIFNNHVQRSVKHKFDFNELKLIFKQFF
jgi:hypothetical protein